MIRGQMRLVLGSFILLSGAFLMSACAPSEEAMATALAQTLAAAATATPEPTATATPTPTASPSSTPAPTPTPDLRVIDTDPAKLLLQRGDLPAESKYYLPNSFWTSPLRNSEIVSGWGVEAGREYLEKTGRVDGWEVSFARGVSTYTAPEEIYDNVVLYKGAEGARLIMAEFGTCVDPDSDYRPVETDLHIGDATNVCTYREMQSSGEARVWYRVEFIYRNVYHAVLGWGWEKDVRPEFVEGVARTLLARLEAAPLSKEVTFSP